MRNELEEPFQGGIKLAGSDPGHGLEIALSITSVRLEWANGMLTYESQQIVWNSVGS